MLSYGITDPPPTWGKDGGVILEWEAAGALLKDYSVFLHMYDAQGHRIAQQDSLIRDQTARPTSKWHPGDTGVALYHLPIAAGTPPGGYELDIGVYFWKTGEELPLAGSQEARLPVQVGVPEESPHVTELRIPHWVEHQVIPELRLLGHDIGERSIVAGDTLYLRLFWEAVAELDTAYRLQLGLRAEDGRLYGATAFELVNTDYPTTQWREEQLLQERYYLPTSEHVPTGEAEVELNLLDGEGEVVLADPVTVARVWTQSTRPSFDVPQDIPTPSGATLGDRVRFLGYDLERSAGAGGDIEVTVHWQAQRQMEEDYKVFVHLYDETGEVVAQRDRRPALGVRPTTVWERGEVVSDRYRIPVDRGIQKGKYRLGIGLYNAESGRRLPAFGPSGDRLEQDRILLGEVAIRP